MHLGNKPNSSLSSTNSPFLRLVHGLTTAPTQSIESVNVMHLNSKLASHSYEYHHTFCVYALHVLYHGYVAR